MSISRREMLLSSLGVAEGLHGVASSMAICENQDKTIVLIHTKQRLSIDQKTSINEWILRNQERLGCKMLFVDNCDGADVHSESNHYSYSQKLGEYEVKVTCRTHEELLETIEILNREKPRSKNQKKLDDLRDKYNKGLITPREFRSQLGFDF